jgi:beta-phosphoglucomutase-like phosphatase (HAD superfamily)
MKNYSHLFFDCDGVILNSNKVKTNAFYKIAIKYGQESAIKLVKYHINNGGVSRYKKIKFFQNNIIKNNDLKLYENLVNDYGEIVKKELLETEISKGIFKIKDFFPNSKLAVISGSDEKELLWLFKKLKIDYIFDNGIFGSPKSKEEIFNQIFKNSNDIISSIYLGDSKYDFEVSKMYGMDFAFITEWTEVIEWVTFTKINNIKSYLNISEFLNSFQ